jgi:seryl-tRNA synthetase
MIDIEQIRKNPDLFKNAIAAKRIPLDLDRLLEIDKERKTLIGIIEQLRQNRNRASEAIASNPDNRTELIAKSRIIGKELSQKEKEFENIECEFKKLMALVPGLPLPNMPEGDSDKDNIEISRWGNVIDIKKDFALPDHQELAILHRLVDFEGARNIAGSRAYALTGNGALLELAIMRFALDKILSKGFTLISPPLLVKDIAMFGTGYFPLGEENVYELEKDKLYLTGTSEVGIVSMHMNKMFQLSELPKRYVGISPCFRREAGAAGKDTKGLYRVHQFQKVEQIVFCANDQKVSLQEHFALLKNAEEIMQALELPYRIVVMCTGDMGLGQVYKHDIETWMPSRNNYCETHSCSSFHDFQSRRLNIRYDDGHGEKFLVYTLNNTAIASPRILIPFLENHQNADGSINIPPALRSYLNGTELIEPTKSIKIGALD